MAGARIKNNVVQLPFTTDNLNNNDTIKPKSNDNGDGGGNDDMRKNDYVTHEELNHATDNIGYEIKLLGKDIDNKFEKINTKFAEQKNWFYGTAISIITITCTIIGLMIKFIK